MRHFKIKNYFQRNDINLILLCSAIIFILAVARPFIYRKEDLELAKKFGYQLSNFDIICSFNNEGILDFQNYMYVIIPLFSAIIIYMVNINRSLIRVLRYGSKNKVWNKNFLLGIVVAFILSTLLVIGGYLVSGIILKGYNNTWNTENGLPYKMLGNTEMWITVSHILVSYKVFLIFLITTFLGLCLVASIINTINLFIPSAYVYLIIIVILLLEYFDVYKFSIIKQIAISSKDWIYTSSLVAKNLNFILLIIGMYFWGKYINLKKDQFIEKQS